MKKILFAFLVFSILYSIFCINSDTIPNSKAQTKEATVSATIGKYHLSITGYQSPFASIVLTTQDGTFLYSTVADSKGYFTISKLLINDTLTKFCLAAVDFKRIGTSEACIDITSPITADLTYTDIFLPPTIGLSKKKINAGQDAQIFGYTLPHAKVSLLIDKKTVELTADSNGFYIYNYNDVPAGLYTFSSTASLDGKNSLPPTKKVTLEALSLASQVTDEANKISNKVTEKTGIQYPIDSLLLPLLALIILIIVGVLLYKFRSKLKAFFADKFRKKHKMHHDWFLEL